MRNVSLQEPEEVMDLFIDIEEDQSPKLETALDKYKSVRDRYHELKKEGYVNPYSKIGSIPRMLSGKELDEIVEIGVFKDESAREFNELVVKDLFFLNSTTVADQDTLKAQTKLLIGHDYDINVKAINEHFDLAIELGEFNYIKDVIKEPKLGFMFSTEHEFHLNHSTEWKFDNMQLDTISRQNSQHMHYQEHDSKRPYNHTLYTIAKKCFDSPLDNDVAQTITENNPAVLDKLSIMSGMRRHSFAKLINTEESFNNLGSKAKNNLIEQHEKLMIYGKETLSTERTLPIAIQIIKFSEDVAVKDRLINLAIENEFHSFLDDVAKNTDLRFNEKQLKSIKAKPEVFQEVIQSHAKKELYDRLQSNLAPKQTKTKKLKI